MEFQSSVSDSDDLEPMDPQSNELEKRSKVMEDIQNKMYKKAKTNIQQAQDRQKKQYDKRRCPTLFKCGDKVLHKNMVRNDRKGGRFIERWNGPYRILECLGKNTYRLQNSDGVALQKKANGCNLKSYKEASSSSSSLNGKRCSDNDHDDNDGSLTSSPPPKKRVCDNESVEIVQQDEISTIDYLPVCGNWQKDRCEAFGLELHRANTKHGNHPVPININQDPSSTMRIVGDGNCFFRALSHIITGSQENYHELRLLVTSFMRENDHLLKSVLDLNESITAYLQRTGMEKQKVWATEVEIFATATMLQTAIFVYAPAGPGHKWLKFLPMGELSNDDHSNEALYMTNVRQHFQTVKRM